MNKTINVNLGGLFFYVDETAYFKLKKYLDAIKYSLKEDEQGREEILSDIESRIAELLLERVTNKRQVVNANDIDEIIKIMGKPEDYVVDDELFGDDSTRPKRNTAKKLFRDIHNKYIGGVCSGLGHYFSIDIVWVRLVFALILLSSFGFFSFIDTPFIKIGFFPILLVYILLWALVPAAKTTSEKLQMKGKPVTIDNIEQKIKEDLNYVANQTKQGAKVINDKIKSEEFKKTINNGKSVFEEVIDGFVSFILFCFKAIGKIIGVLLIFATVVTFIGLFVGLFSWGSLEVLGAGNLVRIPNVAYGSILPSWLLLTAVFIAVGIPLIALFVLGLKILSSKVKVFNKPTWFTFIGLWILAMLILAFAAIDIASQRAHTGSFSETKELPFFKNDTIFVKGNGAYKSRHRVYFKNVSLSKDNSVLLKIKKTSKGKSVEKANEFAKQLNYSYTVANNELILDNDYVSDKKNEFKWQSVSLSLVIPKDVVIYFDESASVLVHQLKELQGLNREDRFNHYYKFTDKGFIRVDTLLVN